MTRLLLVILLTGPINEMPPALDAAGVLVEVGVSFDSEVTLVPDRKLYEPSEFCVTWIEYTLPTWPCKVLKTLSGMLLIVLVCPFTLSVTEWLVGFTETTEPVKGRLVTPLLVVVPTPAHAVNMIISTRAAIPTTICFTAF